MKVLKHIFVLFLFNVNFSLFAQIKPTIEWVDIPSGTFIMGSPKKEFQRGDDENQHQVTLNAFKMSKYEVTFDQYDSFCEATGISKPDDKGWGRGKRPVTNVSWEDAVAFAEWLGCRLPSEAEWEYACRGGTLTSFTCGEELDISQFNFYPTNGFADTTGVYRKMTVLVGSFNSNHFGLFDMHGNVAEWCNDWYGPYSTEQSINPKGPISGKERVFRGGSWAVAKDLCRSASRASAWPSYKVSHIGFRVVKSE